MIHSRLIRPPGLHGHAVAPVPGTEMPTAGGSGVKGWCSSMPPWPTVTADDCGISCHAPGRSANGSETITRSLFASADVESVRRLYPENPRVAQLTNDDRVIVSEPFADLPGAWHEIPQSSAVTVGHGGMLEHQPFTPQPPAVGISVPGTGATA